MSNKLELTWYGKDKEIKLEPRILIENKELSNCSDENCENMLIHGDNLLALKALENKFTSKIKCIYIDPPFNTGTRINADGKEIGFDDGIEHSIWLNLMYHRIKILYNLLSNDGAIFIHLDDNEVDYCKILMDEIFGRKNFMNRITIDVRAPSSFSTVNPGVFKSAEYILFYAKDRNKLVENLLRVERTPDYAYDKYIINIEDDYKKWKYSSVSEIFFNNNKKQVKISTLIKNYNNFIIKNAKNIFRLTDINDSKAGKNVVELKYKSKENPDEIFKLERDSLDDIYILNGRQISFYSKNVNIIDGKLCSTTLLTDIWSDIAWEGIAKEGNVRFKKSKKPEKLIKRCINLVTKRNDLILDSFLGSGTTAAVAHKMGRRWIGIEMAPHAYTHCKVRLDRVISGEDKSGISKDVNWQGGGGYKFYELAPTLIKEDAFGEPIINKEYNPEMLASAVALHEGFNYAPSKEIFWKQSRGNENSYLFVTTQYVTKSYIENIAASMQDNEYLIIACKSFDKDCNNSFKNIKIKKLPQMLLNKCEFNKDNYNLNIIHPLIYNYEEDGDYNE